MRKGIFCWFGFLDPIETRLEMIREAGFTHTSLWWEDESWPKFVSRFDMPELVGKNQLGLDYIHLPYLDINEIWGEDNEGITSTYKRYIEETASVGAEKLVMHIQNELYHPMNLDQGYGFVEEVIKTAEKNKVKIAFENTHYGELVTHLLEKYNSKYLGFCYDTSHDWHQKETRGKLLTNNLSRLLCMHLSDSDGIKDRHWKIGDGSIDFNSIRKIINEGDYDGVFSLELIAEEKYIEEGPRSFLKSAYHSLDKWV